MNNATWLLMALPSWYLGAATNPFASGSLTLVPAIGLVSLVVGVMTGLLKRRRELVWFVLPFVLSEILVGVAGALRGQLTGNASTPLLLTFFGAQVAGSSYLIYRIKEARLSAVALGVFTVTYAAAAVLVAGMSFSDSWL
jgi:hypothetical protein